MALSSTSTLTDILAQIDNSQDYDLDGDITQAKNLISGLRALLRRSSEEIEKSSERIKNEYRNAETALAEVKEWWIANDPNATSAVGAASEIVHVDFQELRD